MTRLYRTYISTREAHAWVDEGTPITVEGTPMVKWCGSIVPAAGWYATKGEAQVAAAEQLKAEAAKTLGLVARLRREAGQEVTA